MKKLLSRVLCAAFALSAAVLPAFAADEIHVTVDGEPVAFTDAKPFVNANDRTMVPLRAVATALGCEVGWNSEAQVACTDWHVVVPGKLEDEELFGVPGVQTFSDDFRLRLFLKEGQNVIAFDHEETWSGGSLSEPMDQSIGAGAFTIDTAPVIQNGRTYLPIRAVAEMYGYSVSWDGKTNTVIINNDDNGSYFGAYNDSNAVEVPNWVVYDGFKMN
ncbi:copper amine oxidase N-terminal domain-containing protein [Agathobaculum sp.]|uniref:copper amine oxidase N-terminal domain-containing protein n=1 Tax=Agathobaculum sp. TaxID=2048138 RepID=UPI002A8338C3|nr:copper amine oxidase N-terminal domain-containing protein [Agathobaculum sp.]MDY3617839.1 copper amine oxidase N-terminal domain-containing protein [Agathobaculum sp.]